MTSSQKLEPFDPLQETFPRYIQRVKIHFRATEVPEERQKFVFLNSLSRKHYSLLANLVSPAEPDSKTLDELVETLAKHFQPKFPNATPSTAALKNPMKVLLILLQI